MAPSAGERRLPVALQGRHPSLDGRQAHRQVSVGRAFRQAAQAVRDTRDEGGGFVRQETHCGDHGVLLPGAQDQKAGFNVRGDPDTSPLPALIRDPV